MEDIMCVGLKAEGVSRSMAILSIYRLSSIIIPFWSTQKSRSFLAGPTPPAALRTCSSTSPQPATALRFAVFPLRGGAITVLFQFASMRVSSPASER